MKIQFENVSFRYESRKEEESVSSLNFEVSDGEFILICGSSGSGKSTVGRIINGLAPYFYRGELSGKVYIDGVAISEIPQVELAGKVGSVFQNPRTQFFDTNSTGELAFGCENMGYSADEIKGRISNAVSEFRIENLLNKKLFNLSGGEKQKIACGSIYAVNPDIYVFDEPSSNLDFDSISDLAGIMRKLKAAGKTVILIEHRIHYASALADRFFYMRDGRIDHIYGHDEFLTLDDALLHQMGLRTSSIELPEKRQKIKTSPEKAMDIKFLSFSYTDGRFHKPRVLNIENLKLPYGKIIALIGKNGAGKSTFLRCMCGLEKGEKTEIFGIDGIISRKRRLKDSYLVMQDVNHQLFSESVEGELLMSDPDLTKENIYEYLSALDLAEYADDHPMALSGGQKQRVAVAAACAASKKYLYLDEPTSGLDYTGMKKMSSAIEKIRDKVSFVLIVTHDPEFILECCDYVMELDHGRIRSAYELDDEGCQLLYDFFKI